MAPDEIATSQEVNSPRALHCQTQKACQGPQAEAYCREQLGCWLQQFVCELLERQYGLAPLLPHLPHSELYQQHLQPHQGLCRSLAQGLHMPGLQHMKRCCQGKMLVLTDNLLKKQIAAARIGLVA